MQIPIGFSIDTLSNSSFRSLTGGSFYGTTKKQNIITKCYVSLYEHSSGLIVARTKSDNNGKFNFRFINRGFKYYLLAHDQEKQFNAVIADLVVPK